MRPTPRLALLPPYRPGRRRLVAELAAAGLAAAALASPVAAALVATPAQSRGPFYPRRLPRDTDHDLVHVAGRDEPARGAVTDLTGRVLDAEGRPVAGALVEIWQCDAFGRYHHPGDRRAVALDPGFQGYGRSRTGADGAYRFLTIRPVPYPGRAPHVHFAVRAPNRAPLVTQMYVAGAPRNADDFLLARVRDPAARARLVVPFRPAGDRLHARFDIVLAPG